MKALLLALLASSPALAGAPDYGILLLAHGGEPGWNAEVAKLRAQADAKVPTELALGMADPATIRPALDALAKRGVKRVVAVPLFVESHSEVMDQTKYVLGLSSAPSEVLRAAAARMAAMPMAHHAGMPHHMFSLEQVKSPVPAALAPALDDDELVSRILLERARGLSKRAKNETVILVAHGPVDEVALPAWSATLGKHAAYVREKGKFRGADFAVLRDDAAPNVRAASVAELRAKVEAAAKDGRALVVPVLIAQGGIEGKLPRDLQGLDYAWDGKTLMPHDGFDAWILKRAANLTQP